MGDIDSSLKIDKGGGLIELNLGPMSQWSIEVISTTNRNRLTTVDLNRNDHLPDVLQDSSSIGKPNAFFSLKLEISR